MSAPMFHAFPLLSAGNTVFRHNIIHSVVRRYARGPVHRRTPLRVTIDGETYEQKNRPPLQTPSAKRDALTPKPESFIYNKKATFKLPKNVVYERLQDGDRRFGPLVMNAKSKKHRHKDGLILLEGKRLILEALECGVSLKHIYFDHNEALVGFPLHDITAKYYKVSPSNIKVWSDMSTPAGVMALCNLPSQELVSANQKELVPVTVVCDNIRDPGNMGTILRSAAAVGCDKVIVPKGCVDIWEPKVLRAGAGAHFRCSLVSHIGWEAVGHYLHPSTALYLADHNKHTQRVSKKVARSTMESIASITPDTYTETNTETGQSEVIDGTFLRRKIVDLFANVPLDIESLFSIKFSNDPHITVVIGGETEGLSNSARKLCFDKAGGRLYVPMTEGTESLNAGVALSVVLFEVKRQLIQGQGANTQTDTQAEEIQE